jgi:tetratricopeptide (TPR) repeat protein
LAGFLDACVDQKLRAAAEQTEERAGTPLPSMREALAMFQAERPGLLAGLSLAAEQGRDDQVKRLSTSMADSLRILRYLDDLLTVGEAALAAARSAGNTRAEGKALNNPGIAYANLGRFEEAITCYQQDIAICREVGDGHGEGAALNNLGSTYQELRRYEDAITCYQQALAIHRETGAGTPRASPWETSPALTRSCGGSRTPSPSHGRRWRSSGRLATGTARAGS